jgi:hypothetical protein
VYVHPCFKAKAVALLSRAQMGQGRPEPLALANWKDCPFGIHRR